jgi:hypothetical protein
MYVLILEAKLGSGPNMGPQTDPKLAPTLQGYGPMKSGDKACTGLALGLLSLSSTVLSC